VTVGSSWSAALSKRRFRTVLLIWIGLPIVSVYLWGAVVQPVLFSAYQGDFQESYMRAASRIAAGQDPYDLCRTYGCFEPTGPQYVMPPLLAWLLQPAIHVDQNIVAVGVVVALNVAFAVFLATTLRALRVAEWQLAALLVLVAMSFGMTGNIDEGEVNPILLGLSGVWLLAWVDGRWWGGVALGAAVAIKVIQAPTALLVLIARRWSMFITATATGLVLWLVATPQYLFEYLFQVAPQVSGGTGLYENQSPGGTITRLIEPATFLGAVYGSPPVARVLTLVVSIAVLASTLWLLRHTARDATGRVLEGAAIVAAGPLIVTYSWSTHLVLLLLPILVLLAWSIRRQDWKVLGLLATGYLLINPGHHWFQALLVSGYRDLVVLRLMAELGVIGVFLIWIAALMAVRRERSMSLGRAAERRRELKIAQQPWFGAEQQDPAGLPN